MAAHRSFAEYVKKKFDNNFWAAAESYLEANLDSLGIELKRIHRAGETEISDVKVEHVWVEDKPGMEVHFDVAISIWFETHEGDYHYDDYDENIVWMMAHCRGDLDKNLDDFEILSVSKYNGKSRVKDPMDDSLVPIIPYEKLDDVATAFLQEYYPAALNKQPYMVKGDGSKVTITAGEGHFSGIDLGIGKYHFEVGAGKENFDWQ